MGQDPVTRTLRNALSSGRVAHAYLFTGPRGVGKTTTARLLAKALACTARTGPEACGACPSCQDFVSGAPVDVMEIDAASNTSVDDIRTLRENVEVRAGARPLQGLHRGRGAHALRGGVQRLPEDARGAARPRGVHPGHHGSEEDSGHRAVALPALRLPADRPRAAHPEPHPDPRAGGRALRAGRAAGADPGRRGEPARCALAARHRDRLR